MNNTTSGATAILGEVVAAAPDAHLRPCGTHAAIKRHKRHRESLCDACTMYQRDYNRDYARVRLQSAVFRARRNEAQQQRRRVIYADPAKIAAANALRRQRRREARRADLHDAQHTIDDVVVLRLISGEHVPHNRIERSEAVRQLRNRGMSYQQIADRLHTNERRVHRDLAALGLTGQEAVA